MAADKAVDQRGRKVTQELPYVHRRRPRASQSDRIPNPNPTAIWMLTSIQKRTGSFASKKPPPLL